MTQRSIDPLIHRSIVRSILAVVFSLSSACAARTFVPPSGVGTPEPDAAAIWTGVTSRCRDTQRFVAEIRVSGWVGQTRERFAATLHGAVTRAGDAYLEVPTVVGTALKLAGRQGRATLLLPLPDDRLFLQAPTRDIVAALTGLPWGPEELLNVLTGCVVSSSPQSGTRVGKTLHVLLGSEAEAWLTDSGGRWQLRAARTQGWTIEYRRHDPFFPAEVRVTAVTPTPMDLTFAVSKQQSNTDVPDNAFVLDVPAGFSPLTLDELRAAGPLRQPRTPHHP